MHRTINYSDHVIVLQLKMGGCHCMNKFCILKLYYLYTLSCSKHININTCIIWTSFLSKEKAVSNIYNDKTKH